MDHKLGNKGNGCLANPSNTPPPPESMRQPPCHVFVIPGQGHLSNKAVLPSPALRPQGHGLSLSPPRVFSFTPNRKQSTVPVFASSTFFKMRLWSGQARHLWSRGFFAKLDFFRQVRDPPLLQFGFTEFLTRSGFTIHFLLLASVPHTVSLCSIHLLCVFTSSL